MVNGRTMTAADNEAPLPVGWERATLDELGIWYGGGTPSKRRKEFWEAGSIPWLSPKDMGSDILTSTQDLIHPSALEDSPVRLIPANSVALVVRSGILERKVPIALVPFETTLNQDMKAISPHDGIDARWLAWTLRAHEQYILRNCRKRGTTVASIEVPWLMNTVLAVPPHPEQERIIEKVDEHIARIEHGVQLAYDAIAHSDDLRASVLAAASTGDLVPQDPNDTPAKAALERIRVANVVKPRRRSSPKNTPPEQGEFPL